MNSVVTDEVLVSHYTEKYRDRYGIRYPYVFPLFIYYTTDCGKRVTPERVTPERGTPERVTPDFSDFNFFPFL